MSGKPCIAVVGATGAVGREILTILEQRGTPCSGLRLLASARSAGTTLPFRGKGVPVGALSDGCFAGVDIALFSAGSPVSKEWGPRAVAAGASVVDNSSAFRMDDGVALIVPEVNGGVLPRAGPRGSGAGIIANPNCTAIIMLVALTPIRQAFGLERIVVSTYQAASGAGAKGMDELVGQTRAVLAGDTPVPSLFHEPYAFNLFSHNTPVDPGTGLNGEETKVVQEARKIWADPSVRISATCIRVPVLRAHSESINVTLGKPASESLVREVIGRGAGVRIVDDRAANSFPTPLKASGQDEVLVGRIRRDPSQPEGLGFDLFICGDQLRKGAALNAIQIAEALIAQAG